MRTVRIPKKLRGDDVIVDAVANPDALRGLDFEVGAHAQEEANVGFAIAQDIAEAIILEVLADAGAAETFEDGNGLVGAKAQNQTALPESLEGFSNAGPELEEVTVVGTVLHPAVYALRRLGVAAGQTPKDCAVDAGCKDFD
jgi:hypothetical protein